MPTTLTGLLLFVVMLLPGFAYLVGKERNGTERRLSPFRETVAIISASVASEVVILLIFAVVRTLWPSETPNVGALLGQGEPISTWEPNPPRPLPDIRYLGARASGLRHVACICGHDPSLAPRWRMASRAIPT